MSVNMSWVTVSGLTSPDGQRIALGLRPGPGRPNRFVVLCSRCDQPYDLPTYHRRLHARGKKPRCRA